MPIYSLRAPNGKTYEFEGPAGLSREKAIAFISRQWPESNQPAPEPKKGYGAALSKGFEQFADSTVTGAKALFGNTQSAATEALADQQALGEKYAQQTGLGLVGEAYDQKGLLGAVGEVGRQMPLFMAEQAPQLSATIGGAWAGAKLGARAGLPGLVGGALGGAATSFLPNVSNNLAAQQETTPGDVSLGKASAAAGAQSALDAAALGAIAGKRILGSVLGKDIQQVFAARGAAAAEALAKERLMASLAKGVALGAGIEGSTEALQDMIERAQAGKSLLDDEALRSYAENAYAGAMIGGPLGGAGRVYSASGERAQAAADERKKQLDARIAATAQQEQQAAAEQEALQQRMASPEYLQDLQARYTEYEDQKKALIAEKKEAAAEKTDSGLLRARQLDEQIRELVQASKPLVEEHAAASKAIKAKAAEAAAQPQDPAAQLQAIDTQIGEFEQAVQQAQEAYQQARASGTTADFDASMEALQALQSRNPEINALREQRKELASKLPRQTPVPTQSTPQLQAQYAALETERQKLVKKGGNVPRLRSIIEQMDTLREQMKLREPMDAAEQRRNQRSSLRDEREAARTSIPEPLWTPPAMEEDAPITPVPTQPGPQVEPGMTEDERKRAATDYAMARLSGADPLGRTTPTAVVSDTGPTDAKLAAARRNWEQEQERLAEIGMQNEAELADKDDGSFPGRFATEEQQFSSLLDWEKDPQGALQELYAWRQRQQQQLPRKPAQSSVEEDQTTVYPPRSTPTEQGLLFDDVTPERAPETNEKRADRLLQEAQAMAERNVNEGDRRVTIAPRDDPRTQNILRDIIGRLSRSGTPNKQLLDGAERALQGLRSKQPTGIERDREVADGERRVPVKVKPSESRNEPDRNERDFYDAAERADSKAAAKVERRTAQEGMDLADRDAQIAKEQAEATQYARAAAEEREAKKIAEEEAASGKPLPALQVRKRMAAVAAAAEQAVRKTYDVSRANVARGSQRLLFPEHTKAAKLSHDQIVERIRSELEQKQARADRLQAELARVATAIQDAGEMTAELRNEQLVTLARIDADQRAARERLAAVTFILDQYEGQWNMVKGLRMRSPESLESMRNELFTNLLRADNSLQLAEAARDVAQADLLSARVAQAEDIGGMLDENSNAGVATAQQRYEDAVRQVQLRSETLRDAQARINLNYAASYLVDTNDDGAYALYLKDYKQEKKELEQELQQLAAARKEADAAAVASDRLARALNVEARGAVDAAKDAVAAAKDSRAQTRRTLDAAKMQYPAAPDPSKAAPPVRKAPPVRSRKVSAPPPELSAITLDNLTDETRRALSRNGVTAAETDKLLDNASKLFSTEGLRAAIGRTRNKISRIEDAAKPGAGAFAFKKDADAYARLTNRMGKLEAAINAERSGERRQPLFDELYGDNGVLQQLRKLEGLRFRPEWAAMKRELALEQARLETYEARFNMLSAARSNEVLQLDREQRPAPGAVEPGTFATMSANEQAAIKAEQAEFVAAARKLAKRVQAAREKRDAAPNDVERTKAQEAMYAAKAALDAHTKSDEAVLLQRKVALLNAQKKQKPVGKTDVKRLTKPQKTRFGTPGKALAPEAARAESAAEQALTLNPDAPVKRAPKYGASERLASTAARATLETNRKTAAERRAADKQAAEERAELDRMAGEGGPAARARNDGRYADRDTNTLSTQEQRMATRGDLQGLLERVMSTGKTSLSREVAGKVLALVGDTKLRVEANLMDDGVRVAALYDPKTNTILLDPEGMAEEDLLHEAVHAVTLRALRADPKTLSPAQRNARAELERLYAAAQKNPAFAREYGKKNIEEFAAEVMTNPQARAAVDAMPPGWWARVKDALLRLIGVRPPPASEKAQRAVEQLFMPSRALAGPAVASAYRGSATQTFANALTAQEAPKQPFANAALGFEMAMVDQRAPILQALSHGDQNKFLQAQYYLRKNDARMAQTYAVLTHGPAQLKQDAKGRFVIETGNGPSAKDIFEAIGDIPGATEQEKFDTAQAYMVAQRAANKGWNKLGFSVGAERKAQADAMMAEIRANPEMRAALDRVRSLYNEYNKGMVQFLVDSGAMTKDAGAALLKDGDYVPFYRVGSNGVAELVLGDAKPVVIGDVRSQPYLQQLKGDEDSKLMPLNEAILRNTMLLTDMGLRNLTTRSVAYALQDMGSSSPKGTNKIMKGTPPAGADIIKFRQQPDPKDSRDTGERWMRVSSEGTAFEAIPSEMLVKSLEGVHTVLPAFLRVLGSFGDLLRKGITRSPVYVMRQLIRDPMAAAFTAGIDRGPIRATFKALAEFGKQTRGASELANDLERKGVVQSGIFSGDPDDMKQFALQLAGGNQGAFAKLAAMTDRMAMRADAATRTQVYEDVLKKTGSEMQAELAAMEMMNFSKRGSSPLVQWGSRIVPFLNAQIQGLNVLAKAARGNASQEEQLQIRQKFIKAAVGLSAMSFLYALAMDDDDEAYKNASAQERYSNFFIHLPDGDALRIPIPYEVGFLFKALPEAMVRGMKDDFSETDLKALKTMLLNSIPGGSSYFLPQAAKPLIEVGLNRSIFTGRDIEPSYVSQLDRDQRFLENTTELSKGVSSLLNALPLPDAMQPSPIQIDYLVRGYLGTLPIAAMQLANEVLAPPSSGERPDKRLSQQPLVGSMFQDKLGRGPVELAYAKMEAVERAANTYDKLVKDGKFAAAQKYMEDNINVIQAEQLAQQFRSQMATLRNRREQITRAPIDAARKKLMLDQLDARRVELGQFYAQAVARVVPAQ